jgi:heterodisulfide reductase subunit A-like polyferredoxin
MVVSVSVDDSSRVDKAGVAMKERILISGSSVAGPTLAFCLAKYGFRPTVVERRPGLRAGQTDPSPHGDAR